MSNTALQVGDRLNTPAEYDSLPIGTKIGPRHSSNDEYTKNEDGTYTSRRYGTPVNVNDFEMGYNEVKELGTGTVTLASLLQWQWRFYDNAYASAEMAGVGRDTVAKAMTDLNLDVSMFPLGAGVRVTSEYNKNRLPDGAVVVQGKPETLNEFGLFIKESGGWKTLLGNRGNHNGYPVRVLNGDPATWAVTPGTEAEQDALKQFKARAWKVGWKVKQTHRWCESYEGYMAKVGLDESVLREVSFNGITPGDKVTAAQAAGLPEGSVLRWTSRDNPEHYTWYIRDDNTNRVAKTRALFGKRADGTAIRNSASSMEVVWIADGSPLHLLLNRRDMEQVDDLLPPGTTFDAEDGTKFVIAYDRKVAVAGEAGPPRNGSWPVTAFGAPIVVTAFGS